MPPRGAEACALFIRVDRAWAGRLMQQPDAVPDGDPHAEHQTLDQPGAREQGGAEGERTCDDGADRRRVPNVPPPLPHRSNWDPVKGEIELGVEARTHGDLPFRRWRVTACHRYPWERSARRLR